MDRYKQDHYKHRNFIYVIEKKITGRWKLEWDFGAFLTYDVAEQVMKDFERYNKYPEDYRLAMYISEKPYDE